MDQEQPAAPEQTPAGLASPEQWRAVAAALADERRLRLYARIITAAERGTPLDGQDLEPKERKSLAALQKAGLVSAGVCDVQPVAGVFARLLAGGKEPPETSVQRFLVNGKITAYPRRQADRLELLHYIAGHVFETAPAPPGEVPVLNERQITERLGGYSADPAGVRRYLVDEGIVRRNREGSRYWLASPRPADGWEFAG
ncbi:DUF2087 domain-containing protein [Arthrobacter sp. ATA002]|uniref:DUF2087 domain-containing protein n=1 Tax=Arthrobacter sp. ATA002 TaxID=2991715 RepID=UPI0022A6CD2C|nr:DUF2087 domain-containing protein [Arthrobacter sp. ATA002]WAP53067.1 DUF2087 domain-containing protein [Arthrobacter sp. ATA002]